MPKTTEARPVGPRDLSVYRDDICTFAENEYILPQTGQAIRLEPHQKRILRAAFLRDQEGRFQHDTVVISAPKKSGKTELGGLIALWMALTEGPFAEIYCPANDLEQSQSRVFRAAARAIQANPRLGSVNVGKHVITFPDGSEIRTVAADAAGAAGANPTLTIWDELWGYTSEGARRLYDELTPVPTRLNSLRLVVTYAGFTGESTLLEELYQRGMAGERLWDDLPVFINGRMFTYWDTEPRMSWQTADYYAEQECQLRPGAFRRLHRNEWVSSESLFIEAALWDGCVDGDLRPLPPGSDKQVAVGVDAATKRDSAAVVGVYREGDRVALAFYRIWKPSPGKPIDLNETVAAYLRRVAEDYRVQTVRYDPYQMAAIASELANKGVRMEELPQTSGNLTEAATMLWDCLTHRSLQLYRAPDLREHALNAAVVETPRGMRLSKSVGSRKIDGLAALSFALIGEQTITRGIPSVRWLRW